MQNPQKNILGREESKENKKSYTKIKEENRL